MIEPFRPIYHYKIKWAVNCFRNIDPLCPAAHIRRVGRLPAIAIVSLLMVFIAGTSIYFARASADQSPPKNNPPTMSPSLRTALEQVVETNEKRLKAWRYLHFKLKSTTTDEQDGATVTAPQPTVMEAWVDEWSGVHRVEYRPRVSRWINGAAPFSIRNATEINDGKKFYAFESRDDLDNLRGREPQGLEHYLGIREITDLIRSAKAALRPHPGAENIVRYSVDEEVQDGKKLLRIREQFFRDKKVSQQRTLLVDPSRNDLLVFREMVFPLAKDNGPSTWKLIKAGADVAGEGYPAEYETVFSRQGQRTTTRHRVLKFEPLSALPAGITELPKSPSEPFVAKSGSPILYGKIAISYINATDGRPVVPVAVSARINDAEEKKLSPAADGKLVLPLPDGEIKLLSVQAKAKGFVPQIVTWRKYGDPLQLPESYTVKLVPSVPISGRVLNEDDQPIEGAKVDLSITGLDRRSWGVFADRYNCRAAVKTNAAGQWTFPDAPEKLDGLSIRVSAKGYRATTDSGMGDFRTSTGLTYASLRNDTADIKLSRGLTLAGRVVDGAEHPVAKARLTIGRDRWGTNLPTTETDASGKFTFTGLAPEKAAWLSVEASDLQPLAREIAIPAEPLTIRLEPGRVLKARVVKEDGTPCAGLNVGADKWRNLRTLTFETQTDADGRFVWRGAPTVPVTFNFGGGQNREFLAGLPLTARDNEQIVVMKPALRLTVRAIDKVTGKPLEAVRVVPGRRVGPDQIYWEKDSAKTYAQGLVDWKTNYMDEQKRVFRLEADGYEPLQTGEFGAEQESFDETLAMVPIAKTAGSAANSIALHLQDSESGEPIASATVRLTQKPSGKSDALKSDDAGLCGLPLASERPSHVSARVQKDGYVPKRIDWNTENPAFHLPREFVLKLEKARTIGGTVTDEAGHGIPGVQLLVTIRGSSFGTSQEIHNDIWEEKVMTNAQGAWTFPLAPESLDRLSIRLVHPDFVQDDESSELPKPAAYFDCTARLVMKRGKVIRGLVTDSAGKPLADVAVLMGEHGDDSTTKPEFSTDASGKFRITNGPKSPGWRNGTVLTFLKKGFAPELKVIRDGDEKELAVTLMPGRKLAGRIVDPSGNPIKGAWVAPDYWRGFRPFCVRLETDADGRFRWDDAPADAVICDVLKDGFMALRNVSMQAGPEVSMTMRRPVRVTATVTDAETGLPVPSFEVSEGTQWPDGRRFLNGRSTLSGSTGHFQWEFSEPSQLSGPDGKITGEGHRFLRVRAPGTLPADSRLIANSEDTVDLTFALEKGVETTVNVIDDKGRPVADAIIAVSGEGNAVTILNGRIQTDRDRLSVTTNAEGKAVLPPLEGNPKLIIANEHAGFAEPTLAEAARGKVVLRGWGRLTIKSASIKAGVKPRLFLNYDSDERRDREKIPAYYLENRAKVVSDGVAVFEGVKPGTVRVSGPQTANAGTVEVPANGNATISIVVPEGVASLTGRLQLPKDIGPVDWSTQRITLQTFAEPPPWPAGLTILERRKWLAETPEGKKFSNERRVYRASVNEQGAYALPDVVAGTYRLQAPVFTGPSRALIGVFEQNVTVPSKEDLAKISGRALSPFEGVSVDITISPPFFRCLQAGERLPDFDATTLAGTQFGSAALRGRAAVLIFWKSVPEQMEELRSDITLAVNEAKARNIAVQAFSTDDERSMTTRFLAEHPLACEVAWIGPDKDHAWMKKFGPLWSPTVLAVNPDGTIRGRFKSAADAIASFGS